MENCSSSSSSGDKCEKESNKLEQCTNPINRLQQPEGTVTKRIHRRKKRERDPSQNFCPDATGNNEEPKKKRIRQKENRHYHKGVRLRMCICTKHEDCIKLVKRWIDLKNKRRYGYKYVKKNERRLYYNHLCGNESSMPESNDIEHVAFHHFHPSTLDDNKGPLDEISASAAESLGMTKSDQILGKVTYYAVPMYPWPKIKQALASYAAVESGNASLFLQRTAGDSDLSDGSLRPSPEEREFVLVRRQMEINSDQMSIEFVKMRRRLEELECVNRGLASRNEFLESEVERLSHELKMQRSIEERDGMDRFNLSSTDWHKRHSESLQSKQHLSAAHHLFGLWDFESCIEYIHIFWDVKYEVGRCQADNLTQFEEVLVTLMKIQRNYEDSTIRLMFGRKGHSFVTDITKKWFPKLGRTGLDVSILDLEYTMDFVTEEQARGKGLPHYNIQSAEERGLHKNYTSASIPKPYIDLGYADVTALIDGKVVRTDTVRTNFAINQMMFNEKVSDSGGLIMSWTTPTGMCFEHTGLYLARCCEVRLVELWATVDSNTIQLN